MTSHLAGSSCHDCPQIVTLPVDIQDVRNDDGVIVDVSVEVDMTAWHAHVAEHKLWRIDEPEFNILLRG